MCRVVFFYVTMVANNYKFLIYKNTFFKLYETNYNIS